MLPLFHRSSPPGCYRSEKGDIFVNSHTGNAKCSNRANNNNICLCKIAKPACTTGANGAACQNAGTAVGGFLGSDTSTCGCTCTSDSLGSYTGDNCETYTRCTKGSNGLPCENGGVSMQQGSGDCACICVNGYTGINCEAVPQLQGNEFCHLQSPTSCHGKWHKMEKQIGKMNPFNYGINNVVIKNDNGFDTYGNGALDQGFNIPRLADLDNDGDYDLIVGNYTG